MEISLFKHDIFKQATKPGALQIFSTFAINQSLNLYIHMYTLLEIFNYYRSFICSFPPAGMMKPQIRKHSMLHGDNVVDDYSTVLHTQTTKKYDHLPVHKSHSFLVTYQVNQLQEHCLQNKLPPPEFEELPVHTADGFYYAIIIGNRTYTGRVESTKQKAIESAAEVAIKRLGVCEF